jgi:integrase
LRLPQRPRGLPLLTSQSAFRLSTTTSRWVSSSKRSWSNFRRCKLDERLSTRTVQYLLFLLRKALQEAVEDGLIPRNVAHGVKVSQAGKEEVRPLSPEQTNTFLETTGGDRFEALYVLAIHTGLRQGKLLGLC